MSRKGIFAPSRLRAPCVFFFPFCTLLRVLSSSTASWKLDSSCGFCVASETFFLKCVCPPFRLNNLYTPQRLELQRYLDEARRASQELEEEIESLRTSRKKDKEMAKVRPRALTTLRSCAQHPT